MFHKSKASATAYLDSLDIDPVYLIEHGVKGIKKLAEILSVYVFMHRAATDDAEVAKLAARIDGLAAHTHREAYLNLDSVDDTVFKQNSMSFFRVMRLLFEYGYDLSHLLAHVELVKERMDTHMAIRGPWQRQMFAEYYDMFDLVKPPPLLSLAAQRGVVENRLPFEQYGRRQRYELTHECYVAFNYGHQRTQTKFEADDLEYLYEVIPQIVRDAMRIGDIEIVAETRSCMNYLGMVGDNELYRRAERWLFAVQNENGSWGNYEKAREKWGDLLDAHLYLHTTAIAIRALIESFEEGWHPSA